MKIQDEDTIEFWRDSQAIEWPMVGFSSEEPDTNQNNWRDERKNEVVIKAGTKE